MTSTGRLVWARMRSSAVRQHDGTYLGAIVFVTDVTERRELEQRLAEEARRDPLTGVANRKELFEVLSPILERGTLTAALYVDLDGFKEVNDQFGHTLGDELLCSVASRRARRAIRVDRHGGAGRRRRVRRDLPRPGVDRRSGRDRDPRPGDARAHRSAWPSDPCGSTRASASRSGARRMPTACWPAPTRRCTAPSARAAAASRSRSKNAAA